jgi:hypothetical protein
VFEDEIGGVQREGRPLALALASLNAFEKVTLKSNPMTEIRTYWVISGHARKPRKLLTASKKQPEAVCVNLSQNSRFDL